jgi:phosphoribosylanthranilate isomerase
MEPTKVPRVKVCCIASAAEAWTAVRLGASALGLVSRMPSGPGVIDDATIAGVAARVPPGVSAFLLTCEQEVDALVAQQRRLRVGTLQLCDWLGPERLRTLREALPASTWSRWSTCAARWRCAKRPRRRPTWTRCCSIRATRTWP